MKKIKIPEWIQLVGYSIEYFSGIFRSAFIFVFYSIKRPAVFSGMGSAYFAAQYAKKGQSNGKLTGINPGDNRPSSLIRRQNYSFVQNLNSRILKSAGSSGKDTNREK